MPSATATKKEPAVKKPKGEKDRVDKILDKDGNIPTAHKAQKSFERLNKLSKQEKVLREMFVEQYQAQPEYVRAASQMQKERAIVVAEKEKVHQRDPSNFEKMQALRSDIKEERHTLKELILVDYRERVISKTTTQLSLFREEESGLKLEYIPEVSVTLKVKEAEAVDADTGHKVSRDPKDFKDVTLGKNEKADDDDFDVE